MKIQVEYEPNNRQSVFHACGADEVVYGGAKGGGKSCGLMMEALAYGLEYPGATIYLFRETYDDLEANLIEEMKRKWPKELYSYHESKHIATLRGGSKVFFRYVSSEADAEGYQGRSIDFVGVDELTKHTERTVQILLSCVRSPMGFPPRFRATCNPGGVGHGWVKSRYIEATNYGSKEVTDPISGSTIAFIPAQVYDNHILMQNDPAYVRRLENLPEEEKRAFLYGDWDVFVGQYFREWRRDTHVIKPFALDPNWTRFISIDWGYNDPCAVYWHAVYDQRVYTYRELYVRFTRASEVAAQVRNLSQGETIKYVKASPDMWHKRGHDSNQGENIAEIFEDTWKGWAWLEKADNDRLQGWNRMREYMVTAPDGQPYWLITENCENLVRTLPALVYDEKRVEDVSDKVEDHGPESCRYGLMSRPSPRDGVPVERNALSHVNQLREDHLPAALRDDDSGQADWHDY
ncbi:terminase family protein [Paenibacillus sp. GYB004]|uniref:terminase large subunit domain-containing protein n=1 Tax=Paenibacillus sp. GYB004 TaxID=2994393 RepID=UPI002F962CA2